MAIEFLEDCMRPHCRMKDCKNPTALPRIKRCRMCTEKTIDELIECFEILTGIFSLDSHWCMQMAKIKEIVLTLKITN